MTSQGRQNRLRQKGLEPGLVVLGLSHRNNALCIQIWGLAAGYLPDVSWPDPRGSWPGDTFTPIWFPPVVREGGTYSGLLALSLSCGVRARCQLDLQRSWDCSGSWWQKIRRGSGIPLTHTDPGLGTGPGFPTNSLWDSRQGLSHSGPQSTYL